ncbi:MAG: C_GCAxxG_C_C family protein [Kiritimatiellae bacterium]|nr:C_GCAxxG_C_C family protein [Kiritimatiellia bacterium]
MNGQKRALDFFREGWNCAQSVLLAHAGEAGLDEKTAARLGAPLGAGVSGLRRTCGALTGTILLEGLATEGYPPGDARAKNAYYAKIREMESEFAAEAGSSICREILRGAGIAAKEEASERTEGYYAARNSCERCIALAERIWLKRHPREG